MRDEILNLIPDDLLNLIWRKVKPSIKYSLNKRYFYKFYHYRFAFINNKHIFYCKNLSMQDSYIIKNFNFIKYLIIHDIKFIIENIILYKMNNDNTKFIYSNTIPFENRNFKNFIEFCYYYSKKFNAQKIREFINFIIKKHKITHLIKKEHKNNNRNIRWII